MRFGVFIRSIGERTEDLCHQAVAREMDEASIHRINGYHPSYKAFMRMFQLAKQKRYDWYVGLDADVILAPGWHQRFLDEIEKIDESVFRFHFNVRDCITSTVLCRGTNIYNGKYTDLDIRYLKKNIRIGRFWQFYKHFGYESQLFTKPESMLRVHFKKDHDMTAAYLPDEVGYHGYEQYYSEIFRQFLVRAKRQPEFANAEENSFLLSGNATRLREENDLDRFVANLGWNFKDIDFSNIDGRINNRIRQHLLDKYQIREKAPLTLGLEEFLQKYQAGIAESP